MPYELGMRKWILPLLGKREFGAERQTGRDKETGRDREEIKCKVERTGNRKAKKWKTGTALRPLVNNVNNNNVSFSQGVSVHIFPLLWPSHWHFYYNISRYNYKYAAYNIKYFLYLKLKKLAATHCFNECIPGLELSCL